MSNTYEGGSISAFAVGSTVTTGAASANVVIPVNSAGELPRYIRVAATTESYVKLGGASVAATANDVMVQPADCVIMAVNGSLRIAYIQGTSSGKVNIIPLENM
jgi:hypothetical protein